MIELIHLLVRLRTAWLTQNVHHLLENLAQFVNLEGSLRSKNFLPGLSLTPRNFGARVTHRTISLEMICDLLNWTCRKLTLQVLSGR